MGAPERCRQHGRLWARFRNALVSSGWATAVLLCMNGLRKLLLPYTVPISDREAFFLVLASSCRLSAVTIASLLMGGCGLSHECVEDGCKSTCEVWGLKTRQNWGSGKFNSFIG